jgi:hypothetical protein
MTEQIDALQSEGAYLNAPHVVAVLERVYKISARHKKLNREGVVTGVPAFAVKSLLSGAKITSAPFNFYPPLTGARDQDSAITHLINLAQAEGERCYVEYKTMHALQQDVQARLGLKDTVFSIVSDLPLATDMETQRRTYKKRHRTKVNKARRDLAHLEICESRVEADLRAWYHLLLRLYRNKHRMICQPFALYAQLLDVTRHSTLLLARDGEEIVGGLFLLHDATRCDYSWGAMHPDYDTRDLATLLLDCAIERAIAYGARTFGFGSSAPSDAALLFFKQRWGCTEHPAYAYYWNHDPKPVDLNTSFSLARHIIARAPLWMLRAAPAVLVPHLI